MNRNVKLSRGIETQYYSKFLNRDLITQDCIHSIDFFSPQSF